MENLRHDIRYALRRLGKSPGFTLVAAATLALGIGANSAIFSVVYGVLIKPLPYREPERLFRVYHYSGGDRSSMSGPNFLDVRRRSQTLADAAAIGGARAILTGHGEPVRLAGSAVSASLFDLLGVQPVLGRAFRADENETGRTNVVILEHGVWESRFGGDPGVIGTRITLDGVPREVVGVMPKGFSYPSGREYWIPIEHTQGFTTEQRAAWYLTVVARAKPGVPSERVAAEVQTIGKQLSKEHPDANEGVDIVAVPMHEAMVGDVRSAVLVLLGSVGFVLLIACANVANLLLARSAPRARAWSASC
jgi:putative ABC transport system permease protein